MVNKVLGWSPRPVPRGPSATASAAGDRSGQAVDRAAQYDRRAFRPPGCPPADDRARTGQSPTPSDLPRPSRSTSRRRTSCPSSSIPAIPAPSTRPSFLAASRLDALALRRSEDAYVDRLFASVVALGAPLLRANFPRAYPRREPRALRTRSAHVRGPAAALRQHPLDAGRRRARHGAAGRRGRPGDLRAADCRWTRRSRASRGSTSPTTACCAA